MADEQRVAVGGRRQHTLSITTMLNAQAGQTSVLVQPLPAWPNGTHGQGNLVFHSKTPKS